LEFHLPHGIIELSMEGKHRKVQVLIAARRPEGGWSLLILKTNKERGQFWQNITGSVEEGETFEAAALREAREESGLELEKIVDFVSLNLSFNFKDRWKKSVHEECFLIIAEEEWKPTLDPQEHENWQWKSLSSISEDTYKYESNFQSFEKAQKMLQRMGDLP
jgi:8-oxo-dGTP pyrophosphatase MutT (NUDIX family)